MTSVFIAGFEFYLTRLPTPPASPAPAAPEAPAVGLRDEGPGTPNPAQRSA